MICVVASKYYVLLFIGELEKGIIEYRGELANLRTIFASPGVLQSIGFRHMNDWGGDGLVKDFNPNDSSARYSISSLQG
jgi:hypothetical protein